MPRKALEAGEGEGEEGRENLAVDVSQREPDFPQETNRVGTERKIGVGGCSRALGGDRCFNTSAVVDFSR